MTRRYGVGNYGINLYSEAITFSEEATVAAVFSIANLTGNPLFGGRATATGSFTMTSSSNALLGGSALLTADFSAYAEPQYLRQATGEASVSSAFGVSAIGSVSIESVSGAVSGAFSVGALGSVQVSALSATISGVFTISALGSAVISRLSAKMTGAFTLSAGGSAIRNQSATVTAGFVLDATAATIISNLSAMIQGNFDVIMEWDEGKFWRPDVVNTDWVVVPASSDIWVKEPDAAPVWRN